MNGGKEAVVEKLQHKKVSPPDTHPASDCGPLLQAAPSVTATLASSPASLPLFVLKRLNEFQSN